MMQNNHSGEVKFHYHPELISLFNSAVLKGILVGNILIAIIYISVFHTFIPATILYCWIGFLLTVSLMRLFLTTRFSNYKSHSATANRYVNYITFSTALNGTIWGLATLLVYLYAPREYLLLLTIISIGIAAGAMVSLSPIYRSYISYLVMMLLPLVVTLAISEGVMHQTTAILILLFIIFVIVGGHKHYIKLRESITLKHKLKLLNSNLEKEVKKRTKELEILNNTLEEKVEEEIAKNRLKDQQIVQQSRMAQMGEMISMIAHQWRQPLGAIAASSIDLKMKMAFSAFDLRKSEEQEACKSYFDEQLNHIEGYVENLTNTIDDFRNFYKPNKEKKHLTINEPIQKSLNIIESSAKAKGIMIDTNYKSIKELALYDSELMQVFLNIIKNAQDNFIEKKIENATIMIETRDTKEGVIVEISDNAGGIPAAIIEKIFDPYFSTKDEKNGTGLGLYMSKTIVEEHHKGKLEVFNKDGGAYFVIALLEEES